MRCAGLLKALHNDAPSPELALSHQTLISREARLEGSPAALRRPAGGAPQRSAVARAGPVSDGAPARRVRAHLRGRAARRRPHRAGACHEKPFPGFVTCRVAQIATFSRQLHAAIRACWQPDARALPCIKCSSKLRYLSLLSGALQCNLTSIQGQPRRCCLSMCVVGGNTTGGPSRPCCCRAGSAHSCPPSSELGKECG